MKKPQHNKNRIVFLRGNKTVLRPPQKDDLPTFRRWMNDPEIRMFIKRAMPIGELGEEEWFAELHKAREDILLAIETLSGKLIGNMGLHRISWIDRHATTGAVIGEKAYWGKGYGTDAKMSLLHYAFTVLNLRKVDSLVYAFNKRSAAYCYKCGYKLEGIKRRHFFRNGRYVDALIFGLFKRDFMPIWERYQKTGRVR